MLMRAVSKVAFVLLLGVVASAEIAKPSINYADVRINVAHAFEERAHEMTATLAALQEVSKATVALTREIETKCGIAG